MRVTRWAVFSWAMFGWAMFGLLLIAIPSSTEAQISTEAQDKAEVKDKAKVQGDAEGATAVKSTLAEDLTFADIEKAFVELRKSTEPKLSKLVQSIQSAQGEARQEAYDNYLAAQQSIMTEINSLGKQVRKLVEKAPAAADSFEMVAWLLKNVRQDEDLTDFAKEILIEHHLDNDGVQQLIPIIASSPSVESLELLEKLSQSGTSDKVKVAARITKVDLLTRYHEQSTMILEQSGESLPNETAGFFKAAGKFDLEAAEAEYSALVDKYADIEFRNSTVGKYATSKLKAIENQKNLQVGRIAPDIEGLDLDGVNFKLSDYRGKVVMLDFWGDW